MQRGVLGRMVAAAEGTPVRVAPEQSVLAHLRVLLNTRCGSCELRPDYGLPDLVDYLHNFPGGVRDLQRALQQAISAGEPRLKNVSVRPLELESGILTLHFEVTASLAGGDKRLRFDTRILRDRRVMVR